MNKIKEFAKALGRRGGLARAKKLSAEERKRIASLGGKARALSLLCAKRIEDNFWRLEAMRALQKTTKKNVSTEK